MASNTVDSNRYNLLFVPELSPVRDWRSEAEFSEQEIPVDSIPPEETTENLVEELKELEDIADGLPEGLEPVKDIVTKLRQRAEILKIEEELTKLLPPNVVPVQYGPITPEEPEGVPVTVPGYTPGITVTEPTYDYDKDPDITPGTIFNPEDQPSVFIGTNVIPSDISIPGVPTLFPPSAKLSISVETPKTLVQIAQESYKKDQIDLQKFYLQKMRMALKRYFQHLLGLTAELGLGDPDALTKKYDGDNVSGVDPNYKHLHDTIIRSQVQRLQKARLFKKIANADQTVMHMRQWNAAEKERERYYDEAYGDSSTFVDSESNALLRQARSDYDAAYKVSLYNMYKYLDSSVKVTEDILDHTLVEAKAKAKLIKEGVDIFKTKEITVTSNANSVTKLQPKTKEQQQAEQQAEAEAKKQQKEIKLTAEDIDKANGIKDPAVDWPLAPNGGHYSKADIMYLDSLPDTDANGVKVYESNTTSGKANIIAALNTSDKYAAPTVSNTTEQSTSNQTQQGSGNDSQIVSDMSQSKIEDIIGANNNTSSQTGDEIMNNLISDANKKLEAKGKGSGESVKGSYTFVLGSTKTYTIEINYYDYKCSDGSVCHIGIDTKGPFVVYSNVKMYDATTISQKIPSNLVQKYQEGLTAATTRYSDIIIRKEQRG